MVGRSLGISSPEGEDVYEIYLEIKSKSSVLGNVSTLMGEHGIDILGVHGQVSDDKDIGYILIYAEMKSATISPEKLVERLKEKDFTIEVRAERKDRVRFETTMFPITTGGHYRVFALGADEWTGLIKSLQKTFGSSADTQLHEQGIAVGEVLMQRIGYRFSKPNTDLLVENFKGIFRAAGYGLLELSLLSKDDGVAAVIKEPIVAQHEREKEVVDYFVIGVVRGAAQKIFSTVYSVRDVALSRRTVSFRLAKTQSEAAN